MAFYANWGVFRPSWIKRLGANYKSGLISRGHAGRIASSIASFGSFRLIEIFWLILGRCLFVAESSLELAHGALGEPLVAVKIVGAEDRLRVAQRMAGDGGDLGHGAAGERKPQGRRAAQIVKGVRPLIPAQASRPNLFISNAERLLRFRRRSKQR